MRQPTRHPTGTDARRGARRQGETALSSQDRPLSPHLQVYRPQLTSAMSIFHRITGVANAVGTLVLVWWLVAAASGPEAFGTVQAFLGSWIGIIVLLGWSLSVFYHLCNGIRHLFWDAGFGFELTNVYRSGVAVLIGAVVLTAIAWIAGLGLL
jgi:succinate dehydrogenase / fumarate reductase cytochrome b subunit